MTRIPMDGFTASILAVGSFRDGAAVLHGPGGCRNYHSFLSSQFRTDVLGASPDFSEPYYGQPFVPCTYIDERDYIYGSAGRLDACIAGLTGKDSRFHVIVESPAAILIGDDVRGAIRRCHSEDSVAYFGGNDASLPFPESYDRMVTEVIKWMSPEKEGIRERTVNLIGLPVISRDWPSVLEDLSSLLGSMGLRVVSSPGCGFGRSDADVSATAEFNVTVCPEYCKRISRYYEKEFGIPTIVSHAGAPVGFDSVLEWAQTIAESTGCDASPVERRISACKKRFSRVMFASLSRNEIRFRRFSVRADGSVALPLVKWLYGYLSMVPASVTLLPGAEEGHSEALQGFLTDIGVPEAFTADEFGHVSVSFADGNEATNLQNAGVCDRGIGIMAPSLSRTDVLPHPIIGLEGAMHILDEIVNVPSR